MTNAQVSAIYSILSRALCLSGAVPSLSFHRLAGGTEALSVHRVEVRYNDTAGRSRRQSVIVKHLSGRSRREAPILQRLSIRGDCRVLPQLLGWTDVEDSTFIVMEMVRGTSAWPWRNNGTTAKLLEELAAFHQTDRRNVLDPGCWDYESELIARAHETACALHQVRRDPDLAELAPGNRTLDKLVAQLPQLRRHLLAEHPFEARLIHGDVHPGNAIERRGASGRPVLIDWGRARLGSPLEDVSSMLQSLRMYEPAALQRHDTLLQRYLTALRSDLRIDDAARGAYWVAAACNALAGALAQHLSTASDRSISGDKRAFALRAAKDWLRVIRRAHAWAS